MKYDYESVVDTIQNTRRFGKLTGLEVSKRMLEQLKNPQSEIPFVHIAGTNGKGSTTAFLCEILKQTGMKVGMFISPHLVTFEERIRINGEYISKEDVTRLGNQLLEMKFDVPPTMFDYCLCMAVLYFKEQNCDIMVMETGIGGRFDSTNALGTPLVSVITKIGFDHMSILGNTLEEIAYEKAGIIKKGVPVILQKQEESAYKVICDYVQKINLNEANETKQDVIVKNANSKEENPFLGNKKDDVQEKQEVFDSTEDKNNNCMSEYFIEVSQQIREYVSKFPRKMLGNFQIENAATALLAAVTIFEKWINRHNLIEKNSSDDAKSTDIINKNALPHEIRILPERYLNYIKQGITQAVWKGRMELVNENPFFMIDGAHNPDGVHALAESLKTLYPNEKFHFIMAVMADKDYETMIEELIPLAYDFVTVTPEYSRALQAKELAGCITKKGVKATYAQSLEEVIMPLLPKNTDVKDNKLQEKTVAFGSLYFIGEIEALL